MTTPELGKWGRVSAREIWPHEARDFTPWLAENLDWLSKVVGIDLELIQEEAPLPGWGGAVDILANVAASDDYVVIENQMEVSDNDHLAGLLNYASHSDSKILVCVAGGFTEWHRRTMDLLNDGKNIKIYGVEICVWSDGEELVGGLKLVSGPSQRMEWPGYEYPADKQKYLDFFRPLVAELWDMRIADRNVARPINDQAFPSSFPGITYHAGFWSGPAASVYLWIATEDMQYNKRIFDALREYHEEIENELDVDVAWDRRDHQRMSAVIVSRRGSIDDPPETLHEIKDWMSENIVRLKDVIQPRLDKVMVDLQRDGEAEAL